jgi:hypothetical protein
LGVCLYGFSAERLIGFFAALMRSALASGGRYSGLRAHAAHPLLDYLINPGQQLTTAP